MCHTKPLLCCRFYVPLVIMSCFVLPTFLPALLWGESAWTSFFVAGCLRYCLLLNCTWFVNSAAHMWGESYGRLYASRTVAKQMYITRLCIVGMRPYDKNINPAENLLVTIGAIGEGFHNYHHTFPQDYATSEFGSLLNPTTVFINAMAKIGWAYDLKTMSKEAIEARKRRTGCLGEADLHENEKTTPVPSKKFSAMKTD